MGAKVVLVVGGGSGASHQAGTQGWALQSFASEESRDAAAPGAVTT